MSGSQSIGMGTFLRTVQRVVPTGVAATDTANVQAALTAMGGVGEVVLLPGTSLINAALTVPDKIVVTGHPNAAIVSSIAPTGGHVGVFNRDPIATPIASTTLNGNATAGASTIVVTSGASFAVGVQIVVRGQGTTANQAASYDVVAWNAGTKTATLDRPILSSGFTSGSPVLVFAQPTDILIDFAGMQVSGTGDRIVSFVSAKRCHVRGLVVLSTTFSEYLTSMDTGSRWSTFEGMYFEGSSTPQCCLEGSEGCTMRRIVSVGSTSTDGALFTQASYDASFIDCHVRQATGKGIQIGYLTDSIASHGIKVIGGSFSGVSKGISVDAASSDVDIIGTSFRYCSYGLWVQATSGYQPGRVRTDHGYFVGNFMHALIDGAAGVAFDSCRMEQSTGGVGVQIQTSGADVTFDKLSMQEDSTAAVQLIYNISGSRLVVSNSKISTTRANNNFAPILIAATAGELHVRDTKLAMGAGNCIGILTDGCTKIEIQNTQSTGGYEGVNTAHGAAKVDTACDFSSTSNPYVDGTGGSHTVAAI